MNSYVVPHRYINFKNICAAVPVMADYSPEWISWGDADFTLLEKDKFIENVTNDIYNPGVHKEALELQLKEIFDKTAAEYVNFEASGA